MAYRLNQLDQLFTGKIPVIILRRMRRARVWKISYRTLIHTLHGMVQYGRYEFRMYIKRITFFLDPPSSTDLTDF